MKIAGTEIKILGTFTDYNGKKIKVEISGEDDTKINADTCLEINPVEFIGFKRKVPSKMVKIESIELIKEEEGEE